MIIDKMELRVLAHKFEQITDEGIVSITKGIKTPGNNDNSFYLNVVYEEEIHLSYKLYSVEGYVSDVYFTMREFKELLEHKKGDEVEFPDNTMILNGYRYNKLIEESRFTILTTNLYESVKKAFSTINMFQLSRPVLSYVNFKLKDCVLQSISTNIYLLSVTENVVIGDDVEFKIHALLLEGIIENLIYDETEIVVYSQYIVIRNGDFSVVVKRDSIKYPDVSRQYSEMKYEFEFNVGYMKELIHEKFMDVDGSLKLPNKLEEHQYLGRFEILHDGSVTLGMGKGNFLPVKIAELSKGKFEFMHVYFNVNFLIRMLEELDSSKNVRIGIKGNMQPFQVIQGNFKGLLCPIRTY